jgi:hypothetical protein
MRQLHLLIIAIATICVLALGVFAFVRAPKPQPPGDVIIIKGGSLTIECPDPNDSDCMPFDSSTKKYKHKKSAGKILAIVIKDSNGVPLPNGSFTKEANFPDGKPIIEITYK